MTPDNCEKIITHLSRIQGQIEALKGFVREKRSCEEVAQLTKSISSSFVSVRKSIAKEMLCNELPEKRFSAKDHKTLDAVLSLYA